MKNKILLSLVATAMLSTSSFADTAKDIKELKAQIADLQAYIEDVEDNLGAVETRSYSDKIQLGLGMRVEANNYSTTYANGSSPANEGAIWRTKLNINMKSKIADNLKFTGRLSTYKNWGDSSPDYLGMTDVDSRQGRTPDNSNALYVERAYLDWYMTKGKVPLTLTIGRQPSSDGPSYQIKEGTARKGTYDALAFDGAADGVVLTANLSKVTPGKTALRITYGKPNNGSNYQSDLKDTTALGVFIDKECEAIKYKHLIQAYYVVAKDLNANPRAFDMNSSSPTYMTVTGDKNIGDFDIYGAMFEIQNVNKFDFFIHYSYSIAKPNGKTIQWGTQNVGLLSSASTVDGASTDDKTGDAIWLGTRYKVDANYAVGAEYNKGSQYWFSATYAPNDPMNKLATRGDAIELYASKKINKFANIRVGYVDINYDYTGSGMHLGTPMKIDDPRVVGADNQAIKEKTNTYITFNVLF